MIPSGSASTGATRTELRAGGDAFAGASGVVVLATVLVVLFEEADFLVSAFSGAGVPAVLEPDAAMINIL